MAELILPIYLRIRFSRYTPTIPIIMVITKTKNTVLISSPEIFWSLYPNLQDYSFDFKTVWDSATLKTRANLTNTEIAVVRNELKIEIRDNENLKYLVFDWVDPYGTEILDKRQCNNLDSNLKVSKIFTFITPNTKWRNQIIICEVDRSNN